MNEKTPRRRESETEEKTVWVMKEGEEKKEGESERGGNGVASESRKGRFLPTFSSHKRLKMKSEMTGKCKMVRTW